jgi:tetratricopeptide (TPR) repeat protein
MSSSENRTKWIYGPGLDMIVGCGAWSAPLLLVTYWLGGAHGLQMSLAFYALTLVANNPHYMATIYRAYRTKEDFSRYRIFTLHLTVLLVLTAVAAHWSVKLLPVLYTIYLTWSPWHYAGQNFGIALMFARRNEIEITRGERNALYAAFVASFAMIFLGFHSVAAAGNDPYLLNLGIPVSVARVGTALALGVFVSGGLYALVQMGQRAGWRKLVAPTTLYLTQGLWFVLPLTLQMVAGLQAPLARYSTGVLAFMHSAQYLWITSYYAKREAEARPGGHWRPLAYFGVLIVGGIALFVPGPWLVSTVLHRDFTTSFFVFASLVNIHHFILDGAIWKLRDGRIAAMLLDTRSTAAERAGETATAVKTWLRWLTGRAAPARALRVVLLLALIGLAGLDQVKYYLGYSESNPANLARAASLNPFDAAVFTRQAKADAAAGNEAGRIQSLQKAVALNPFDVDAQRMLGQSLIADEQFEAAYRHYQTMFQYIRGNSEDHFNLGMLASQLGYKDIAVQEWQTAIALDPHNLTARAQLAEAFHRQGELSRAIDQREQYLSSAARDDNPVPADLSEVLYMSMRLADEYRDTKKPEAAMRYYDRVIALAERAGDARTQSEALSARGAIKAEKGNPRGALDDLQHALKLAQDAKDAGLEGTEWYDLARFLQWQGVNPKLVLTCLLRAEELHGVTPNPEIQKITAARQDLAGKLGAAATAETQKELSTTTASLLTYRLDESS